MEAEVLPEDYQEIIRVVTEAVKPVKAGQVSVKLSLGTLPGQVEAVRAKLKRLAERGWLHRTPAGRYCLASGDSNDN
ncbi:hypothetical protein [Streptomyces sp. NBC_01092]|uniref:hypothetical protein n=1 Tax=Streptomyces sp. NBC_01092 TaxID=2903748 RepID=UPI003870D700|nr:hypothetical protein OG254_40370 [Streptomyces sp. NBC_01092]